MRCIFASNITVHTDVVKNTTPSEGRGNVELEELGIQLKIIN
ncbi:hypothetical protein J2Y60_003184 [Arcicella sp. BE140]|nr:hypothetical protein [Arcicella sp. BE140]MDR6562681.1 hypothetical protein [Arcicella sp. BE51]MDR6812974.1 hypothetical protein [Arcicella sp. BE140]MDR6824288.1 hypothetical protein [Arcicella sp. BE139]